MRIYYLDRKLTPEELSRAGEILADGSPVEQIRIPHVLPAPTEDGTHGDRPIFDEQAMEPNLRKAGILRDGGRQVAVVIPQDSHWYLALGQTIFHLTGFYPYLVQTRDHRVNIGNPGDLRIIDMHGMLCDKGMA